MAEEWDGDEAIFVYTGGDQVVPMDVVRVRIDKTVTIIPSRAFEHRTNLIYVEFHDGIEIVENHAFNCCTSLRSVKLLGVKIVGYGAFVNCRLEDVELGDKVETIEGRAFMHCTSLSNAIMPSLKNIGEWAFCNCQKLTDLELPEGLETLQRYAFSDCIALRGIAMPLKSDMIGDSAFTRCPNLMTLDIVGGVHRTIASLHLESWKNQMKDEVNIINLILPNTLLKTIEIREWMSSVVSRLDHYKAEHKALLKEATTLLELALWKANLDDNEGGIIEHEGVRTTRGRRKRARKEICVTSGASIVIKNVLPFLTLLE